MHKLFSKIRFIVAVAAGKGGVGKSSMTVNIALTLKGLGYSVGVLDADLYGPSLGHMMPLQTLIRKNAADDNYLIPGDFEGIKVFSISQVRSNEYSMSVRAPIINGLLSQITKEILWGELDYLFVDFPPGTGDIQLSLLQTIPFSGAIIITIPSEISVIDVKKTVKMFQQLEVPLLGVIENMSYFLESSGTKKHYIFGQGGGEKIAATFGIPFLGQVPIDPNLCKAMDDGINFMKKEEGKETALQISEITDKVKQNIFTLESLQGNYLKQFELVWEEK